jgi:alpha-amylase
MVCGVERGRWAWALWALLAACASSGGEPAGPAPETLVQPTRADGEAPQGGEVADAVDAQARPKLDGEIVYFVMLDRFADGDEKNNFDVKKGDKGAYQGGDLAGLTQKLDYLAELGVTTVWITPIVDQVDMPVTGAGFPDWAYHGYWGDDFEKLDRHLGDEAALQTLLDEAHKRGLKVMLDVVINHAGYRSRWAIKKEWTRSLEHKGCPEDAVATELDRCLFGLPDFRTEDRLVAETVLGWGMGWVRRFPFDGFRFDTLKHAEAPLFAQLRREGAALAKSQHGREGFWALGEWWGSAPGDDTSAALVESGTVDALFDFGFHGVAEGFVSGRMRAEAVGHHLEAREGSGGGPWVHFLDTHDVPTFLSRLSPEQRGRYPLAAVMQMTSGGIPLVTWGNELGREGGEWPLNRSFMPWERLQSEEGRAWHKVWKELIALRKQEPALRGTGMEVLWAKSAASSEGASLVYRRGEATERLKPGGSSFLVVLARGAGEPVEVSLPTPASGRLSLEPAFVYGGAWAWERAESGGKVSLRGAPPVDSASVWRVSVVP